MVGRCVTGLVVIRLIVVVVVVVGRGVVVGLVVVGRIVLAPIGNLQSWLSGQSQYFVWTLKVSPMAHLT